MDYLYEQRITILEKRVSDWIKIQEKATPQVVDIEMDVLSNLAKFNLSSLIIDTNINKFMDYLKLKPNTIQFISLRFNELATEIETTLDKRFIKEYKRNIYNCYIIYFGLNKAILKKLYTRVPFMWLIPTFQALKKN